MRPKILFVGPWWWGLDPGTNPIRGTTGLTAKLNEALDLKVFVWPTFKSGPKIEPHWRAVVDEMRRQMPADCHVVDSGPGGALSLHAITGRDDVKSLVLGGMTVPPATLRALGMVHQAEGSTIFFRTTRAHQLARLNLQGADDDFIADVGSRMDAGLNWEYLAEFQRSFEGLNLLEDRPDVRIPVLYMDPPLMAAGYAEMAEVVLQFVPQARVEPTELYPSRMQDPASGIEFAEKANAFIEEVERSAAQRPAN
jgi:hypothetical protein